MEISRGVEDYKRLAENKVRRDCVDNPGVHGKRCWQQRQAWGKFDGPGGGVDEPVRCRRGGVAVGFDLAPHSGRNTESVRLRDSGV